MSVPLVLAALRMLFWLKAAVKTVLESIVAPASTRPTTRLTVPDEVPAMPAGPVAALYPGRTRNWPSLERVRKPSEVAVPLDVRARFPLPDTVAGSATD